MICRPATGLSAYEALLAISGKLSVMGIKLSFTRGLTGALLITTFREHDNVSASDNVSAGDNVGANDNAGTSDNTGLGDNAGMVDNASVGDNAGIVDNTGASDNAGAGDNVGMTNNVLKCREKVERLYIQSRIGAENDVISN